MKNLSIVLNAVLLVAVAVLYIIIFTFRGGDKAQETMVVSNGDLTDATKIVYINTDTLMSKYRLAQELNEAFLKKQEERRTELNIKAKSLDQEYTEFQRKLQNNGFISEARATDARDQILIKQQNLQRLQQEMTDKMMREQSELNRKLLESVTNFLSTYQKEKGFDIVLGTIVGGTVLYSPGTYDITNDVVERLNAEYEKSEKK